MFVGDLPSPGFLTSQDPCEPRNTSTGMVGDYIWWSSANRINILSELRPTHRTTRYCAARVMKETRWRASRQIPCWAPGQGPGTTRKAFLVFGPWGRAVWAAPDGEGALPPVVSFAPMQPQQQQQHPGPTVVESMFFVEACST